LKRVTVKRDTTAHAILTCTISQFKNFIGPKIRNDVQILTKAEKRKLKSICQNCGKQTELDAAHIKGNDRLQIINSILKKYTVDEKEQIIQIDLNKVRDEILQAHKPITEHVKFLCSECHKKYDSKNENIDS
jgi:DNA-directed RNA polymerase subunit RPC12/RpoP